MKHTIFMKFLILQGKIISSKDVDRTLSYGIIPRYFGNDRLPGSLIKEY